MGKWMVFKNYDNYEANVEEFEDEEEARTSFEDSKRYTSAKMYLAEVKDVFNTEQPD